MSTGRGIVKRKLSEVLEIAIGVAGGGRELITDIERLRLAFEPISSNSLVGVGQDFRDRVKIVVEHIGEYAKESERKKISPESTAIKKALRDKAIEIRNALEDLKRPLTRWEKIGPMEIDVESQHLEPSPAPLLPPPPTPAPAPAPPPPARVAPMPSVTAPVLPMAQLPHQPPPPPPPPTPAPAPVLPPHPWTPPPPPPATTLLPPPPPPPSPPSPLPPLPPPPPPPPSQLFKGLVYLEFAEELYNFLDKYKGTLTDVRSRKEAEQALGLLSQIKEPPNIKKEDYEGYEHRENGVTVTLKIRKGARREDVDAAMDQLMKAMEQTMAIYNAMKREERPQSLIKKTAATISAITLHTQKKLPKARSRGLGMTL